MSKEYKTISECQVEASEDKPTYLDKIVGVQLTDSTTPKKPAVVMDVRERMIESRKAAAEIVANMEATAMAKLEEALNLPMEERMARRLEIIKDMTQEEINACFVNGKVSIGELAQGMGIPEVNYPTAYDWDRATPEPVKYLGVFKERTLGVYTTDAGLVCKEEPGEVEGDWPQWVIRDQEGKELGRRSYIFDFTSKDRKVGDFHSYQERTGRRGDTHMDMKFGLAHFPPGTVFQVRADSKVKAYREDMKPYEGMDTFTVKHVSYNGPRSFLISCVEQRPGLIHPEEMEDFQFNVSCVVKILKRGPGKVVVEPDIQPGSQSFKDWLVYNNREVRGLIENEKTAMPKLRKGEHLFFSPSGVAGLLTAADTHLDVTENASKYVSDTLWNKYLVSTNCVRYVHIHKVGEWSFGFYAVNVKKFSRWLKKNAHRVFHNLDACEKQDQEADHRLSSEMMWD